jgi:hypothetical protein
MLELITAPADHGNPALTTLFDPEELAQQLERFSYARWGLASPQGLQARVLKWHSGKRCTLEIVLKDRHTSYELIAKIYSMDCPDIYKYLKELQRAGFDRHSKFSTPQALGYVPSLRLLLEEKVHGVSVREVFLGTNRRKQVEAAERSALWLARFHDLGPRRGSVVTRNVQLAQLEKWLGRLSSLGGPVAQRSKKLFRRLETELPKLGAMEYRAGHSSYSPDHVLLRNDQTVTIDWDTYDVADPARDVARFIVATERLALGHLGSIRALDGLVDAFLKTYVAERGAGVLSRLPCHRAMICLKLAKYCAFNGKVRRWEERVATMLDEGIRVLRTEPEDAARPRRAIVLPKGRA